MCPRAQEHSKPGRAAAPGGSSSSCCCKPVPTCAGVLKVRAGKGSRGSECRTELGWLRVGIQERTTNGGSCRAGGWACACLCTVAKRCHQLRLQQMPRTCAREGQTRNTRNVLASNQMAIHEPSMFWRLILRTAALAAHLRSPGPLTFASACLLDCPIGITGIFGPSLSGATLAKGHSAVPGMSAG